MWAPVLNAVLPEFQAPGAHKFITHSKPVLLHEDRVRFSAEQAAARIQTITV
jgi:hypothetical protein